MRPFIDRECENLFSVSIQAPGLGSTRRIHGANDNNTNGSEMPRQRRKDAQCVDRRLREGRAHRGRHERRGAGVATMCHTPVKNDALVAVALRQLSAAGQAAPTSNRRTN